MVVPSRGGVQRLPTLLEALSRQDFKESWEVVVVLDEDIDGSRAVIEQYADRLPLRVVERARSEGVATALREGYSAALGAIVIRCDDDLTPKPDFVARHIAWHQDRPTNAPLGVIALTRDVFDDTAYAAAYGASANARLRATAYARPPRDRWMHWAACNSIPKTAYEAVGGFDPAMSYREDSELGLRLAKWGVEMIIDPALEIEHRGPATNSEQRAIRAYTSGASTRAFEDRHPETKLEYSTVGAWGHLVALISRRVRTHEGAGRMGRVVDRVLPATPKILREKLVAMAIEAAGRAGHEAGMAPWHRH